MFNSTVENKFIKLFIIILAASFLNLISIESAYAATGDSDTYFNLENNATNPTKYAVSAGSTDFYITNAITMEAWVYPISDCVTETFCHVVRKETAYTLAIKNGTWQYALNGAAAGWYWSDTGITAQLNQWQHIALVRQASSSTVTFYLNGKSLYSGTSGAIGTGVFNSTNNNFNIGAMTNDVSNINQTPIYSFLGSIDEIKVWQVARTASEVVTDMNNYGPTSNTNLKLYYDFNDVSGTSLTNKALGATSTTTLTLKNSPTFTSIETSTVVNGNKIVTFTRNYLSANGWKAPIGVGQITALIVGGGGGGGFNSGGGGSGGGIISSTFTNNGSGYFPIVGTGGIGNTAAVYPIDVKANGDTSTIAGMTSSGGNSGINYKNPEYYPASGGASVNGYGAGGRGSTASASALAGSIGFSSSITGTATYYGGGGGGGGWAGSQSGGSGGSGGGGAGSTSGAGASGTKNTGGGGGASAISSSVAGNGGSGVIILSFSAASGTASAITNAAFRSTSTLSVEVNEAGKVSFYAKGNLIAGCKNKATTLVSPFTATCTWKPSQRGSVVVSARFTANSVPANPSNIPIGTVFVTARGGTRQ